MNLDHNYLSIVTTMVLLAIAYIGYLSRGWISHVNYNLSEIKKQFEELRKDREQRWLEQTRQCSECKQRLTWVEARVNGKKEHNHDVNI